MSDNDWKARQQNCPRCKGAGYQYSESRHEDGHGLHAWAAPCECQPRTIPELEDAAQVKQAQREAG